MEYATLGGGCFWIIDSVFRKLKGVLDVVSGYSGGLFKSNPTYEDVAGGRTGHAQVCQIRFDSNIISFDTLLKVFFMCHDPTQLNREDYFTGIKLESVSKYHVVMYHDEK